MGIRRINNGGYGSDGWKSSYLSNYNSSYTENFGVFETQRNAMEYLTTGSNQNAITTNIFRNTKDFKDVTKYRLMRGVPDFGSLVQFNPYETGYAAFIICQVPRFMEMLAKENTYYRKLLLNWCHVVEYEFKSFDGLEAMGSETIQLGDDLNNINVISKVNMQSAGEFSLTYDEKSGGLFTKFHRLYLTGVKDGRTQVKNYHGLIHANKMDPGFENECFTFLYINTDNTMREVEAAYLLIACQINAADTDMYTYTKGEIGKKEITVKFNGYPVQGAYVDMVARDMMQFLLSREAGARQIIINSNNFMYTGLDTAAKTLRNYGATSTEEYPSLDLQNIRTTYNTSDYYQSTNGSGNGFTAMTTEEINA